MWGSFWAAISMISPPISSTRWPSKKPSSVKRTYSSRVQLRCFRTGSIGLSRICMAYAPGGFYHGACPLNVEIHAELERVRPHADGVDLVLALVLDPVVNHVGRED